jgi:trans-aconitate methyltransferase
MRATVPNPSAWDADLYEAKHNFVFDLGKGVVDILNPQPGERILDVGCGTGQLTEEIHERMIESRDGFAARMMGGSNPSTYVGARESTMSPAHPPIATVSTGSVTGIDPSETMIKNAKENYPNIAFQVMDVTAMPFEGEFDAVFSNAVLHWIPNAEVAVINIARALKPGARFVAEFGGRGNVATIVNVVIECLIEEGATDVHAVWFYPSIGEYTPILERNGLEVRQATLYDRPTKLQGEDGLHNWLTMFGSGIAGTATEEQRNRAYAHAIERLKPTLYRDGSWWADYRRIQIVAVKTG